MTVIDASSVVAYCLREEGWEGARDVLTRRPRSPELVTIESANAILKARRQRRVTSEQATAAVERLRAVNESGLWLASHHRLLDKSLAIAEECGIAAYDALYLALARQEATPLATRDRSQADAARRLDIRVLDA